MSSDLIHGKRKRSDSEFDSDTESVGNNFPGQNMDFSYGICGKVMTELAKARLKMDPYSTIGGWSDPHLWSTLMRVVDGFNSPNMRDNIMEIIFMFEQLFLQKRVYEVTDDELRINMYTVFGPGSDGDAGSLRTCNLDCNLLAIRRLHSDEVPPTTLQCDVDDVGQCVVQDGGGPSNSDHIRKKAKTTTFTAPSEYERLYNPNSPSVPPRNFEKSMFSILSRNDMLELYRDSTEHLTPDDRGLFLFYVAPGDITFQTLAMSSFAKRKDIVDSMVKKIKARKSSHHPTNYRSHHPQE